MAWASRARQAKPIRPIQGVMPPRRHASASTTFLCLLAGCFWVADAFRRVGSSSPSGQRYSVRGSCWRRGSQRGGIRAGTARRDTDLRWAKSPTRGGSQFRRWTKVLDVCDAEPPVAALAHPRKIAPQRISASACLSRGEMVPAMVRTIALERIPSGTTVRT